MSWSTITSGSAPLTSEEKVRAEEERTLRALEKEIDILEKQVANGRKEIHDCGSVMKEHSMNVALESHKLHEQAYRLLHSTEHLHDTCEKARSVYEFMLGTSTKDCLSDIDSVITAEWYPNYY